MEIYDSHFTPSAARKLKAAIEEACGNEVFARGIMSDDGLICDIEVISRGNDHMVAAVMGWGRHALPDACGGFFWVYMLGPCLGAEVATFLFVKVLEPLMNKKTNDVCCCGKQDDASTCGNSQQEKK